MRKLDETDIAMVVIFIFLLTVLAFAFGGTRWNVELKPATVDYALTACVVEIDKDADVVTFEDYNGNLWTLEGVEDWEMGDCASLLMNNQATAQIEDDVIRSAHYEGWTLMRGEM